MGKKYLTPQEIVEVYDLRAMGDNWREIKERVGVSNPNIIYANLQKHLAKKARRTYKTYKQAINIIKARERSQRVKVDLDMPEPMSTPQESPKTTIFGAIWQGINQAIDSYIDSRIADKGSFMETEIAKTRLDNQQIRKVLEDAKIGNWVTSLKKQNENEV